LTSETPISANEAAKAIYQEVLDDLSEATLHFDPEALCAGVQLPMQVSTLKELFIIETAEDWLGSAKGFSQYMRSMGVNHFIRIAHKAEFLSENYIEGRHVTYIMRNAEKVVPDYENRTVLTRVDGRWRVSTMDTSMENDRWPVVSPKVNTDCKPDWHEVSPEADARRKSTSPMSIYQTYLDRLTLTNMEDDFDGWCALCNFPHTVHINQVDQLIEDPDGIRPFFDMLTEQINLLGITRISRHATRAEFISPTQICGYHTTTLGTDDEVKLGPFDCRYILTRVGTRWRMSSVTNTVANETFPYDKPEPSDTLITLQEIQKRMRSK
jgi:hypothetical protein